MFQQDHKVFGCGTTKYAAIPNPFLYAYMQNCQEVTVEPSPYSSSHTHSSPLDQLSSLTAVLVTHLSLSRLMVPIQLGWIARSFPYG